MEALIKLLTERTGITEEQASKVVETVQGFLKENPEKLTMFLGEDGKPGMDDISTAKKKLSGLFRR